MEIKPANKNHYLQILDIYNWAVRETVATFDTEEKQPSDQSLFFKDFEMGYPMLVLLEKESDASEKVIGFGLLKAFSDRKAYDRTCELSIYIAPGYHRRGLGSLLMEALIESAIKFKQIVIISKMEANTKASIELHRKHGFKEVGVLNKVGFKFNQWLDVMIMQKSLP